MTTTTRLALLRSRCGACSACGSPTKQPLTPQEMIAADPLPLAKGAKWTYDVTVKRFDPDTDKEIDEDADVDDRGRRRARGQRRHRVSASRAGRATSRRLDDSARRSPTERTILRSGNSFLFGAHRRARRSTVPRAGSRGP